jgi:hypothetical protein
MAIEWTNKEDWNQSQDNTGVVHDPISDNSGHGSLQQGHKVGSLTEGLVAYYPMENSGSAILRDGARKNTGRINGATWDSSGQVGNNSLSFDGTNDYVDIPVEDFGSSFTITSWYNADTLGTGSNNAGIVEFAESESGFNNMIGIRLSETGDYECYIRGDSGNDINSIGAGAGASTGTWHHVALTYDGSGARVYHNGEQIDSSPKNAGKVNGLSYGSIGRTADPRYFHGQIEEVRIYDRSLSQPEINALSNLTSPSGRDLTAEDVPSSQDSGISRYKFNGDVTDSWGSNDGTDNTSAGYVNGVYGQAKDFDGSDDTITDIGPITLGSMWSVSCWYKPNSFTDYGHIFTSQSSQYNFACKVDQNGNPYFYTSSSGSLNTGFQLNSNEWHHLVYQYDGSKIEIYINADLKLSESASLDISSDTYRVQGGGGGEYVEAAHDDLRIYDRTLSPLEVEKLFHLGARRINRKEVLH